MWDRPDTGIGQTALREGSQVKQNKYFVRKPPQIKILQGVLTAKQHKTKDMLAR
jgi:hypothetical protein